jgi:hypothetical protein
METRVSEPDRRPKPEQYGAGGFARSGEPWVKAPWAELSRREALKKPKWLQSLSWEKASTKSATVKEVRRQTDKNLKQQRAQEEQRAEVEKNKSDGRH